MSLPATPAYRSAPRRLLRRVALALTAAGLGVGAWIGFWAYQLKRFDTVAPGVLYRSGQPTEFGLSHAVRRRGVRTVVSLQMHDFRLHRGWYDPGAADGEKESEFVRALGAQAVQWPMGDESCWPWPDAWELEEFFHLLDNPDNRPVLIHCMGGRHRTGTFSAIYRLEYDRRSADAALDEMYSFSFGKPIPIQEINLRTYQPRPLPDAAAWRDVAATFGLAADARPADAVPVLVHRIRAEHGDGPLRRKFDDFATSRHPYALPLASRVIHDVDDPVLETLLPTACAALDDASSTAAEWTAAAALIADFGSPADQRRLLALLQRREPATDAERTRHDALACGVMNRYTANRVPFLRVLLDDDRPRLGPDGERYTYAEAAVGRMAAITDELPVDTWFEHDYATKGRSAALAWLETHAEALRLTRVVPPQGRQVALEGDGSRDEDLSRMRR